MNFDCYKPVINKSFFVVVLDQLAVAYVVVLLPFVSAPFILLILAAN